MDTISESPAPRKRNKIVIGCFAGIVIFAALAALGTQNSNKLKATEPYKLAIKRIQEDSKVAALLGAPITDEYAVVRGRVDTIGDRGNATLEFRVKGKKSYGEVRMLATLADGAWTIDSLEVVSDDKKTIVLNRGGVPEAEK